MKWRLARSLVALRAEVDAAFPNRPKQSDGTLGDTAHASRPSDHNPNSAGVVRAFDCTNIPGFGGYAEHIRQLGASGHPALQNHGYVIHNRQAAYATNGWKWRRYTGSNPHTQHTHVSVGRDRAQYDNETPWRIGAAPELPDPPTDDDEDELMALSPETQKQIKLLAYSATTEALRDAGLAGPASEPTESVLVKKLRGVRDTILAAIEKT